MKIELAVYTAINGYDWQPGSPIPRQELNSYSSVMGALPQFDMGDDSYGGVFCNGRHVVFYRYLLASGKNATDCRGRTSVCIVLGRAPAGDAPKINFREMFAWPVMNAVATSVPPTMEYAGTGSSKSRGGLRPRSTVHDGGFLSEIGCWLAECASDFASVKVSGVWPNLRMVVDFRERRPVQETPRVLPKVGEPSPTSARPPCSNPPQTPHCPPARIDRRPTVCTAVVAVVALLALCVGLVAGWYAHVLWGKAREERKVLPVPEQEAPKPRQHGAPTSSVPQEVQTAWEPKAQPVPQEVQTASVPKVRPVTTNEVLQTGRDEMPVRERTISIKKGSSHE